MTVESRTRIVAKGWFGEIDFGYVSDFTAVPKQHVETVRPINAPPMIQTSLEGWDLSFTTARNMIDKLQALIESALWDHGAILRVTLHEQTIKADGSVRNTTWNDCSPQLEGQTFKTFVNDRSTGQA